MSSHEPRLTWGNIPSLEGAKTALDLVPVTRFMVLPARFPIAASRWIAKTRLSNPMRSLVLVVLCLCLAASGTATAMPMIGTGMAPVVQTTSTMPDCPDMAAVAGMPAADDGTGPIEEKKPDCCRGGGCACAAAHAVFLAFWSPPPAHSAALPTTIVMIGDGGYASPALARLVRPPIS